jgi:DNA helicase II / ATP-dependent DNA helicase PcrA
VRAHSTPPLAPPHPSPPLTAEGKTALVADRILHAATAHSLSHDSIWGISFSNQSVRELRDRLDPSLQRVRISTFHSLCYRLLKKYDPTPFSILDRAAQTRLIQIAAGGAAKPDALAALISRVKNTPPPLDDALRKLPVENRDDFRRVLAAYSKLCHQTRSVDFDDLLVKTLALLRSRPDVLGEITASCHFLVIDEFQDTNEVQYEIARLIASRHLNITVVGDLNQSIYGWRCATSDNFKKFRKDFRDCVVASLGTSHRCTG